MLNITELQDQFPNLELLKGDQTSATGLRDIYNASAHEATFFVNDRYRLALAQSQASVLITSVEKFPYVVQEFKGSIWNIPNPLPLLHRIGQLLEARLFGIDERWSEPGIHPTAIVEEGAEIHPEARVGPYCVIRQGAKIEAGVSLLAYVYVGCKVHLQQNCIVSPHASILARTVVGEGTKIMAGAVLGSKGFSVVRDENGHNVILPQLGRVVIGKQSRIGCNATVDRATFGETILGDRGATDNLTQLGHNVKAGTDFILCALSGICGSTKLGDRVTFAALSGAKDHVEITDDVTIGALTGVLGNVTTPHVTLKGTTAMPLQQYLRQQILFKRLPDMLNRIKKLEKRIQELESEQAKHG